MSGEFLRKNFDQKIPVNSMLKHIWLKQINLGSIYMNTFFLVLVNIDTKTCESVNFVIKFIVVVYFSSKLINIVYFIRLKSYPI